MGKPAINRRDFFRTLSLKNTTPSGDPLFEKYSRKTLGPRVYSNEYVDYFAASNPAPSGSTSRIGNITSGLNPYTGSFGTAEAMHLLKRTGFGFKKSAVDTLVAAGSASAAVDIVLTIDNTAPAPPLNWYNNNDPDQGGVPYGGDWTNNAFSPADSTQGQLMQTNNNHRVDSLRRWLFGLALNQDNSIREKMMWFWYHFIPIDFETVRTSNNQYANTNSARIMYTYMKFFRDNAFGNFRTMMGNIALEPAMMFYLNNQANTAAAPDENYAREQMELFTLGKDPLSQYTQADVVAAAQVLTGWRVQNLNTTNVTTGFVSGSHSTTSKQFSSFFNNTVINNTGATELDSLLNMIFSKTQVVSEYICRRLYRYFIYYDIDANIEANVITPLAQTFVTNNWNILAVLQQLFKSEHFFDMANRGVYIKSPFDLVIGSLRHFNINTNVSDPTNYESQYKLWAYLNDTVCLQMEQQMGTIPNVSGWNAFYQTPAFHEYWINTNTVQKRFAFMQGICTGFNLSYNGLSTRIQVDCIAYVQQFNNALIQDPNILVAECVKWLLPLDLSSAQLASIKQQTLLYQQTTDSYWTTAWNNYTGSPTNTGFKSIVSSRLLNLLYTLVQLAEFQLI